MLVNQLLRMTASSESTYTYKLYELDSNIEWPVSVTEISYFMKKITWTLALEISKIPIAIYKTRIRGIGYKYNDSISVYACVCVCARVCVHMGVVMWRCHLCREWDTVIRWRVLLGPCQDNKWHHVVWMHVFRACVCVCVCGSRPWQVRNMKNVVGTAIGVQWLDFLISGCS